MPKQRRVIEDYVWDDNAYDGLLETRVLIAEREKALEAEAQSWEEVRTAMAETGKRSAKDALSAAIAQGMEERKLDRESLEGGISITRSEGERESLDKDLLIAALEEYFADADEIAGIVEAATARTPFAQIRVNFPRKKARPKPRRSRLRK